MTTWTHDPSHYPEPMSRLSADVWFAAMGHGIQAAASELRAPFGGFETMTTAGGWAYEQELEPAWAPEPERVERAALEVAERWEAELRPTCWTITHELRAARPERHAPAEAAALLERLVELVREQWRLHFLVVIPVHAAREVLHDAWVERFGKADELEPYRLMEGLANETLDADEQLWRVGELARELDVDDVILELPASAALERLAATHHGRRVTHALDGYLLRFGGRSRLHELSEPRDAERPELVVETLRLMLEHPRDLAAERAERERRRDAVERDALARLEEPDRARFADVVRRVCAAVPLEESHAYHIDYPGLQATREALLGFGRRLVAEGAIQAAADVFMLRLDELRDAVAGAWGEPLQPLVAERARALAEARRQAPAPWLGTPPDPAAEIPPMVAKFYGVPGTAEWDGEVLQGTPASPGRAAGIARVISGPDDFGRLEAGDVLVCTTTTPAWTPLFASAGALVTDTGGILSHAAIVAREYRLPAVVGCDVATSAIPDGSRVEVDGHSGRVRLVLRQEAESHSA
ncbi:MAG TPA: PEP-utilizing enzyme [Thermoleophilaceae bacterium]|nr:PEP-utilizing enzyme [Thermoleophilaceae bacterium]